MKCFKKHLIGGTAVILLAIIGTFMSSHRAGAQGPPNGLAVNLVNPLPVPVTGSITIPGTVSAKQSGAWNVGINNPATAPVFVLHVDEPGRIPYEALSSQCNGTATFCNLLFPAIPSGHRLVIQHVSINAVAQGSSVTTPLTLDESVGRAGVSGKPFISFASAPTALLVGGQLQSFRTDQPVQFYVEAGEQPFVGAGIEQTVTVFNFGAVASLTGYLLDCTAYQCAPIVP